MWQRRSESEELRKFSTDEALRLVVRWNPTYSEVQNYSSQVSRHNTNYCSFNNQHTVFLQCNCNTTKGRFLIFYTLTSHSISPLDKNSRGCSWEISLFSCNRKDQEFRREIIDWQQKDNSARVNSLLSQEAFFFLPSILSSLAFY